MTDATAPLRRAASVARTYFIECKHWSEPFAEGSWLTFVRHGGGNEVMVMGDLVLMEDEVSPVVKRLIENGVEITAIHNHLLRASPSTL